MTAFGVLNDPVRRRLVELMASRPTAAGSLTAAIVGEYGISQPAVSNHLRVLRDAGIAVDARDGARRIYSLVPGGLDEVAAWVIRVTQGSGVRTGGDRLDRVSVHIPSRSRPELLEELRTAGVLLNPLAETLLASDAFDESAAQTVEISERTVAELGLPEGATLAHIVGTARSRGLALAPVQLGPALRLFLTAQASSGDSVVSTGSAPVGSLTVASAPLSDDDEFPKGFYLRVVDGQPWLRGYRCDDEHRFSADDRFVFAVPDSDDLT